MSPFQHSIAQEFQSADKGDFPLTIHEAVKRISKVYPDGKDGSGDVFLCGDPALELRGIVSTFMPTLAVLRETVHRGANLVIAHEPIFYGYQHDDPWLRDDAVCCDKWEFIKTNGLVIWRFHDGTHVYRPDCIAAGVLHALGWNNNQVEGMVNVFNIPPATLRDLAVLLKERLNIEAVKIVGNPEMLCRRVALKVGAPWGKDQMELLSKEGVDVMITGEVREWETCEFVRDACASGSPKGLIVLGHANSEEAGVEWITERIRELIPASVSVAYVKAGDPFRFV